MPIHDQGYRRYAGRREARGQSWRVIARAAHPRRPSVAACHRRCCCCRLAAVPRPRRADLYAAANIPAGARSWPPRRRPSATFLDLPGLFVFFVTISSVRPDRRRPARQRAADLPVEAADPRRVHRRQAGRPAGVPALRHAGCRRCCCCCCRCCSPAALTFLRANLFLLPAITLFALMQSLLSAFTMLALSSLSKSRRFVAIMYAGLIFFTAAMYQALRRHHRQPRLGRGSRRGDMLDVLGDAIFRVGRPGRPIPVPAASRRRWC